MDEMKDCIEREKAISICERLRDKTDNDDMAFALNWAIQSINNIPSVDVRPMVRGKWETISFMTVRCSNCKETFHELEVDNFCPNCGADMREINYEAT